MVRVAAISILLGLMALSPASSEVHEFICTGMYDEEHLESFFESVASGDTLLFAPWVDVWCDVCSIEFPINKTLTIQGGDWEPRFYPDMHCGESTFDTFAYLEEGHDLTFEGIHFGGYGTVFSISGCSPTFNNCTFERNGSLNSGPIVVASGTPVFNNCFFIHNSASYVEYFGYGGYCAAVKIGPNGGAEFYNCLFSENHATYSGTLCYCETSAVTLTDCTFEDNLPADREPVLTDFCLIRACCLANHDCIVENVHACTFQYSGDWLPEIEACSPDFPCDTPVDDNNWGEIKLIYR
jgi:Right handed beta helix region